MAIDEDASWVTRGERRVLRTMSARPFEVPEGVVDLDRRCCGERPAGRAVMVSYEVLDLVGALALCHGVKEHRGDLCAGVIELA